MYHEAICSVLREFLDENKLLMNSNPENITTGTVRSWLSTVSLNSET